MTDQNGEPESQESSTPQEPEEPDTSVGTELPEYFSEGLNPAIGSVPEPEDIPDDENDLGE